MLLSPLRLVAVLAVISLPKGGGAHRFGYKSEEQKVWREHSEHCDGKLQSPIHIVSHRAVPMPLPALEMIHYHNLLPSPMRLANSGHSVSLKFGHVEEDFHMPQVFGALLPNEYELDSLHFHWGHRNSRGSEHIMNGIKFPVEMHIIHYNIKYNNLTEAFGYMDGLAVLAFFFQVREKDNMNMEPILRAFQHVRYPDEEVTLDTTFTLASLLDTDLDVFYTYLGSLTTPPCSEAVTWIIFPDPLYISFTQIKKFRRIMSGGTNLVNNFRSTQPLNNRIVYVRKMWQNNRDGQNNTRYNSTSWFG